jgi:hypothetical protein
MRGAHVKNINSKVETLVSVESSNGKDRYIPHINIPGNYK